MQFWERTIEWQEQKQEVSLEITVVIWAWGDSAMDRSSYYILKVESDTQIWEVMYTHCQIKGSLESHNSEALVGPRDNPFHSLVEFSHWEFISSEIIETICFFFLFDFVPNHKAFWLLHRKAYFTRGSEKAPVRPLLNMLITSSKLQLKPRRRSWCGRESRPFVMVPRALPNKLCLWRWRQNELIKVKVGIKHGTL